jgi:hypothetical protein
MKKMPISYMTSNGNGYYLQKRIPKDLLPHYPDGRSGIINLFTTSESDGASRALKHGMQPSHSKGNLTASTHAPNRSIEGPRE